MECESRKFNIDLEGTNLSKFLSEWRYGCDYMFRSEICSWKNSVHGKALFMEKLCSWKNSVRGKALLVEEICSVEEISKNLFNKESLRRFLF